MMKLEWNMEIKTPDDLLLLEINDRIHQLSWDKVKSNSKIIASLKIDKKSLQEYVGASNKGKMIMAKNLIEKIDYILELAEQDDLE
jgi:adenylate kinase family enzyme